MLTDPTAQARVVAVIITGTGFTGGRAILKNQEVTPGSATAASFWSTGAIGISVDYDKLEIAIVTSLIVFITLRYVKNY